VVSSLAVANGVVYIGSYEDTGIVEALSATSGAELWAQAAGNYVVDSSPAVADGVVYAGSDGNGVYAFNAATGAGLWSYSTGNEVTSSNAVS
jgi:eukaryotic-like serine/threonine-protein kinase